MGNTPYDYDEIMAERFRSTLDHFMRKGGYTAKSLGRALAVQPDTIESYRQGTTRPQYAIFWRFVRFFGAAFLNELAEPAGITGAFNQETRESCHYSLITHLAHFMHIISKALEDGQIDKSEAKVIRHMLPGIKAVIHAFEGSL